jgi:alpha-tubulin suppressor-like RCC1 family protein
VRRASTAGLLLLVSGCARDAALVLEWDPVELADDAIRIELVVHDDVDCSHEISSAAFTLDDRPDLVLPAGDACFVARARNDRCQTYAAGERRAAFPTSDRITIVMTATEDPGCPADAVCREDACVRGEAIGAITQAVAGRHHTCLAYATGDVQCFGLNADGEVGQSTETVAVPATVPELFGTTGLALGGRTFTEGASESEVTANNADESGFTCAIDGGTPVCFGANDFGELGRGGATGDSLAHPRPEPVVDLDDATELALGGAFVCALRDGGAVACWGRNALDVLGVKADGRPSTAPVVIEGLPPLTQVAAGHAHACGVAMSGELYCWGGNYFGALGVRTPKTFATPRRVALDLEPGDTVAAVAAGGYTTCVRTTRGDVWCWGWSDKGQAGVETGRNAINATPTRLDISGVAQLVLGTRFGCARGGEAVMCWGEHRFGQLGTGTSTDADAHPIPAAVEVAAADLSCGTHHCCALLVDGDVACWGRGSYARLGDREAAADAPSRTSPVRVIRD